MFEGGGSKLQTVKLPETVLEGAVGVHLRKLRSLALVLSQSTNSSIVSLSELLEETADGIEKSVSHAQADDAVELINKALSDARVTL